MSILIGIFTVVLLFTSVFLILVVLAQKAKADGGMGAALGGGATEAAFGADTGNVLTQLTIKAAIVFFVLCFGLYLGQIYVVKHQKAADRAALPTIAAPAAVPAATPAVAPAPVAAPVPAPAAAKP